VKKDIAEKWVAALRSGEYKQCRHQLRTQVDEYCCLGVLCEVLKIPVGTPSPGIPRTYVYDGEPCTLSKSIRDRVGLVDCGTLMSMNDDGETFATIADYIEKNAETL
jgi:hypothetical protein